MPAVRITLSLIGVKLCKYSSFRLRIINPWPVDVLCSARAKANFKYHTINSYFFKYSTDILEKINIYT